MIKVARRLPFRYFERRKKVKYLNHLKNQLVSDEFATNSSGYRKVAESRPVYYSNFEHFGGATNRDVLLLTYPNDECIKGYLHEFISIFVNYRVHGKY